MKVGHCQPQPIRESSPEYDPLLLSADVQMGAHKRVEKNPAVLIVDDEPESLALLHRTLRSRHTVVEATSGPEGLGCLDRHPVKVIVADQRMPGMTGIAFLAQAARRFPQTQRILITAYTEVEGLIEAINAARVFGYVTKPWHPDELLRIVERAAQTCRLLERNSRLVRDLMEKNRRLQESLEETKRLEADKIRAERWAALGRLAGMVAHDLKNPLTAIQIQAGLLKEGEVPESLQERSIQSILDQVARMRHRVEELLLFGKPRDTLHTARPYPIPALIRSLDEAFRDRFRELDIRLEWRLGYTGSCWIQSGQIYRVLENLIQNAIDALQNGGEILVATEEVEPREVVIRVADSGSGIPREFQSSLFQPFATWNKPAGTGLGLAIVKKIVEEHGGRVWQEPHLLRGACFHLTLPREPPEGEDAHPQG